MNIEDLKKLSTQDALQAAAKFAGVDASVFDGIWRAESNRGTAMVSPAGARGHFGLMPKTQALFEKKLGVKVNPDDFHDSLYVAMNHFKDDLAREGGNVVSALRAYNNGPKWREQRDPRGENAAYASRVLGAKANELAAPTSKTAAPTGPVLEGAVGLSTPAPFPVEQEAEPTGMPKTTAALASAGFVAGLSINPQEVNIGEAYKKTSDIDLARQSEIDNMGFIDTAQALFMHQGIVGGILKRASRGEYSPVEGYVYPEERLAGRKADDQSFLLEARSPEEATRLEWELDVEQEDMRRASLNGGWYAAAAGIFAGLPEGVVTGVGTAKLLATAGMGSAAAMAAGQGGRSVALNVLENVGGNVAATAVEDAISGRMSMFDYAVAGTVGLAFSGLSARGLMRGGEEAMQAQRAEAIAIAAVQQQQHMAAKAARNLGEGATAEQIAKEIARLEAEEVTRSLGTNTVGADRRILPDLDKLEADEVAAEAELSKAKAPEVQRESQTVVGVEPTRDYMAMTNTAGEKIVRQKLSANEYLAKIASTNGDLMNRQVASRLMTALGVDDVPIYVIDEKDMLQISKSGTGRAHYNPNDHAVFITSKQASSPAGYWVVNHELAHAASLYKLHSKSSSSSPEVGKISREIGSLRMQLTAEWEKTGKSDYITEYYLKNDDEFVAGLYSGQSTFLDWLKTVPVADKKTAWNSFVDIMRRLLNIPEDQMNAFTKALNLSEQLFSRPLDTTIVPTNLGPRTVAQAPLTPTQQTVAQRYGLDMMPIETPAQRAEQKAMVALYAKAEDLAAPWNNMDPKWLDSLTAKFPALGSTGLLMLRSKNPVARMVAAELLESTTGAGGRRTTASIGKYMAERKYMGNTINELQDTYKVWRNAQGGGIYDDFVHGKHWEDFNRKVAEEMEARNQKVASNSAPAVKKAADILEAAYERMRIDQIDKKTVGWGALPDTSKGYMPHRMSGEKVRNMTQAQHRAFHSALVDQFVSIEGWDISFSANLAAKYIDRAKVRAMGGHEIPANVHHTGAAEVVRDALKAMGMSNDEIHAQMQKYTRGGAGHTKARIKLNLLQEFDDNGQKFTLMDLFDTDQLQLVRNQAQRVSGEVALAKHGIMGAPGLTLLRRAMADFGEDAGKVQPEEVQAFDQVAAEFLGQPFGDYGGKWMNRAMQANSLARLGGMGFTQFGEYINAATHLGVVKAFSAISGLPRLRAEAAALARGEKVNNPIIGSIEVFGGAEFGTDAYKMVFPFDNPSLQYQVNGHDTVTLADRLLRGGSHAQGKLSFWRAIHGAQQRGVAEQIVHKAVKMIRDSGDSKVLADMGIDQQLASDMRAELSRIATFDDNGRLAQFDITKAENVKAAEQFVQAVHRGTGQIIQGTFIGETGKWAHSGWLRLMTQFRTFSITSVEKQWGRNRNNHGVAAALGMLMGSMAMAAPIYMARQYVNSIGREDREEWLAKQLSPEKIARATMNYVASSGLAGDFLDAFAAITGTVEATGGRAGGTTEFVGTVIAPAAGLADDLWRGIQNSKDGTDVHELIKNLPFAKLPFLVPAINLMDN